MSPILRPVFGAVAAAALLAVAGAASAHAHLVSSDPVAGSTVAAPRAIVLTFSEKLEGKFSGATLIRDGAPLGVHGLLEEKAG